MADTCTNCGADLKAAPVPSALGGFDVICSFCGHRHHIAPEPAPAAQPDRSASDRAAPITPRPVSRAGRWVIAFGVLLTAGGIGLGFTLGYGGRRGPYWEGGMRVVTIGGSEAVLVRLRNVGTDDQLSVAAFDATTMSQRWKAGPYGTYTDAYRFTYDLVAGSHVLVTDSHAKAHVLDLQTGKEQRVISLTDRVTADVDSELGVNRTVCVVDAEHVWLEQVDKKAVLVDVASGSVHESPPPKECSRGIDAKGGYADARQYKVPNFEPLRWSFFLPYKATSALVLLGKKTPGTPTPMVVGLHPKDETVSWQVPLPVVDLATVRDNSAGPQSTTVCGDRFIAAYGVGQKSWHVTALDAATGARQWDVVLRPIFSVDSLNGIGCSATRVYVGRMSSIDVLEATTGSAVGTIGTETYQ